MRDKRTISKGRHSRSRVTMLEEDARVSVGYSIKELAPDDRPRERLKLRGPSSLGNDELLAIVLNTGIAGEGVMAVSKRLLSENGGFLALMKMDVLELAELRGLGPAK